MCQLVKSQGEEGGLQRMQPRDPNLPMCPLDRTRKTKLCREGGDPRRRQILRAKKICLLLGSP